MRSTAAIFGAPVTDPPGKVAHKDLGETDSVAQRSLHGRDHVLHPGELAGRHEHGPTHAAGLADAREIVPLEVDDHHVLCGVLLGRAELGACTAGPRSLDGHRPDHVAAAREEELGRRGHDRPAVTGEHLGMKGLEWPEAAGELARVALERGLEVLHEVHLIDVTAGDRLAHLFDGRRVLGSRPRPLPVADGK